MLIGHNKQWQFLTKSFELGRIPHSLLFQGQKKVGKRNFALEFIKFINCQDEKISGVPCQKCLSCREMEKICSPHRGTHPDFILVEPLKKEIQISQIRDLSLRLASKPFLASFKSAIIDKAHLMSPEAQGCFLKTLEEPKGKVLLILITEYPKRLLPTILSRVQRIKFYPVKKADIKSYLISQGLSENKAKELSDISFGKPGRAIEFLLTPAKLDYQKQKIADLIKICDSSLAFRFQYLKDLSLEVNDLKEVLEVWLRYFRKKLLEATNDQPASSTRSTRVLARRVGGQPVISKQQPGYSLSKLKEIVQLIQDTFFYISTTNVNPKLALEVLFLEL